MKKIILFILVCLFQFSLIAQNDSIYVVVNGNIATIHQDGTVRNCGALYEMIITKNGQDITWLQKDTGDVAYCLCHFDLSVTIGPLDPGNYLVGVYSTEIVSSDTIYWGSVSFSIDEPGQGDTVQVIATYQSECYNYVNINESGSENITNNLLQNYPNPFSESTTIQCNTAKGEGAKLIIYDILGQPIRTYQNPNGGRWVIKWDGRNNQGIKVPPGIYFYSLTTQSFSQVMKLQLLR